MSQASRERERARVIAASPYEAWRRGYITLEALRAHQAVELPKWLATHVHIPDLRLAHLDTSELVPMVYPEPVMEEAA